MVPGKIARARGRGNEDLRRRLLDGGAEFRGFGMPEFRCVMINIKSN